MTKICHHPFNKGSTTIKAAPSDWQVERAHYCDECGGIRWAVQEEQPVVRGPANARHLYNAQLESSGRRILSWQVGDQNGKERTKVQTVEFYPWHRRFPMTETEPMIFKTWELLMSKVKVILAEPAGPSDNALEAEARERARYEARGIAEVLAILMKPFMESPDHVVKCAVRAYKDPSFEPPGLGLHLWDPMMNPDGTPRTSVAAPKQRTPATPKPAVKSKPKPDNSSTKTLSAEEAEGIREAVSSGMFSKEEVAIMFKVSIPTVEAALKP